MVKSLISPWDSLEDEKQVLAVADTVYENAFSALRENGFDICCLSEMIDKQEQVRSIVSNKVVETLVDNSDITEDFDEEDFYKLIGRVIVRLIEEGREDRED